MDSEVARAMAEGLRWRRGQAPDNIEAPDERTAEIRPVDESVDNPVDNPVADSWPEDEEDASELRRAETRRRRQEAEAAEDLKTIQPRGLETVRAEDRASMQLSERPQRTRPTEPSKQP